MLTGRFDLARVTEMPWKNGGGTTRELLTLPPGSDVNTFAWRVSVATLAANGPFSVLPGVERVIVLLTGDGVRLVGTTVEHRLDTPAAPFEFDGGEPLACVLLGQPGLVLNMMTRQGQARLEVCTGPTTITASTGLVLSVSGAWRIGDEVIRAGCGRWWVDSTKSQRATPIGPAQLAVLQWLPGGRALRRQRASSERTATE